MEKEVTLEVDLNFYAVRSKDGKFLRKKSHSYGSFDTGKSWTDNIAEAKIYSKPGPARSQCTWWSRNYPKFGSPDLVLITTAKCIIINEDERIDKQKRKIKLNELESKMRDAKYHLDVHLAKVEKLRGDGKDSETKRLKAEYEKAKTSYEEFKKM